MRPSDSWISLIRPASRCEFETPGLYHISYEKIVEIKIIPWFWHYSKILLHYLLTFTSFVHFLLILISFDHSLNFNANILWFSTLIFSTLVYKLPIVISIVILIMQSYKYNDSIVLLNFFLCVKFTVAKLNNVASIKVITKIIFIIY
jgi:hypothetical protein